MSDSVTAPFDWRAHLPVHPAADRFPLLSEAELKELAEDIRKNGLQCPIVIRRQENDSDQLIDGRNRLDALALLGLIDSRTRTQHLPPIQIKHPEGFTVFNSLPDLTCEYRSFHSDEDATNAVVALNIHRRHLTAEQKHDLIAELLKADPSKSDRQIAEQTKTSPTTVGKVRAEKEASGDVSKVDTRTDCKGRKQPSNKKPKSKSVVSGTAVPQPKEEAKRSDPEQTAGAAAESDPPEQSNGAAPKTDPRAATSLECCSQGIGGQMQEAVADLSKEDAADLLENLGDIIRELKNEIGIEDKAGNDPLQEFKRACNKWLSMMTEEERKQARVHHMEWKPKQKRKVVEDRGMSGSHN